MFDNSLDQIKIILNLNVFSGNNLSKKRFSWWKWLGSRGRVFVAMVTIPCYMDMHFLPPIITLILLVVVTENTIVLNMTENETHDTKTETLWRRMSKQYKIKVSYLTSKLLANIHMWNAYISRDNTNEKAMANPYIINNYNQITTRTSVCEIQYIYNVHTVTLTFDLWPLKSNPTKTNCM